MNKSFLYYIDIVGTCNLRCPSCPVGNINDNERYKGLMSIDLFEQIIQKAIKETPHISLIGLYNWAEAFLHPKLPEFIEIINKYGLRSAISTNFNKSDNLEQVIKAKPSTIRISLSGFYQDTYSLTHKKGNIEVVKENMIKLRDILNRQNSNTYVDVAYHKYLHNMEEDFKKMYLFCRELGFAMDPAWAFIMPYEKLLSYYEDKSKLSESDFELINKLAINPDDFKEVSSKYKRNDCPLRSEQMTINADGSVPLCCAVYDNNKNISDNFLNTSHEELQRRKYSSETCKICMKHNIDKIYSYIAINEINEIGNANLAKYARNKIETLATNIKNNSLITTEISAYNGDNNPLVAVGFPVYNGEKTLSTAIESILNQDYENIVLIICDNASTDKTEEICQKYVQQDKRVVYYRNEVNIGAINNFKKAFDLSDSEYFMWLAHDDYYDKSYISKCLEKLIKNPLAVSCCSEIVIIDENQKVREDMNFVGIDTTGMNIPDRVKALISRGLFWYEIYALYRTEYLKKIDLTREKHAIDVIILLELMLMGEIIKVPEKLFYYSFIPEQKSHQNDMDKFSPGAKSPERPYTFLIKELHTTVMNSYIDEQAKMDIYKIFAELLPTLNPGWMNCLLNEHNLPNEHQKVFLQGLLTNNSQEVKVTKDVVNKNLKIVHLTAFPFGGAGIAAYRIHKGMLDLGMDSTMFVLQKKTDEDGIKVLPTNFETDFLTGIDFKNFDNITKLSLRWHLLYEKSPNRPQGLEMFSDTFSITNLLNEKEIQEADVIHLHWISGLLDYNILPKLAKNKSIFWTLHDVNSFTGGCHYAGDCNKYQIECGYCPQLGSEVSADSSNMIWHNKEKSYKNSDIHVISPSTWLAQCARKSSLFSEFTVDVIHHGFSVETFRPYDKVEMKKKYNIDENAKVILFGADAVLNQRKGFKYLEGALALLNKGNIILSVFGKLPEDFIIDGNFTLLKHGLIEDKDKLAEIYSLADLIVVPSVEEAFGQTATESMACGTPVVAFDVGGLSDIVDHKKTGFLAKLKDIDSLAEGISWVLDLENPKEVSDFCRNKALKEFDLAKQTKKYIQKYSEYSNFKKRKIKLSESDLQKISGIITDLKELLNKEQKYEVTRWAIEGLLLEYPDHPDLLELKSDIELFNGNKLKAKSLVLDLLEMDPNNSTLLYKAAEVLWELGRVYESLYYLERAFNINLSDTKIVQNYIETLSSLELVETMKSVFRKYIDKKPDDEKILSLFAEKQKKVIKDLLEKRETYHDDKYLVSAIVSTYNSERFIKGCIKDLGGQTISNMVEIIIIDSNSPQNEEEIIRSQMKNYPNIKYIKTKERETVYQAWNRAIKISSGKYITNSNTDDRHRNDAFEVMVKELELNLPVELVYAPVFVTENENETFESNTNKTNLGWLEWDRKPLLFDGCFMGPQPMWRRKVHDEYGYFDDSLVTSGDYEFWVKISQTHNFKRINEFLGLYLESPTSLEHTNMEKQVAENRKFLTRYQRAYNNGEIINRIKELPKFDFSEKEPDVKTTENIKVFKDVEFFVDYKWNPKREISEKGYFILIHKWESYSLPDNWITPMNKMVDQIWVPSNFVKESYINSGIIQEKIKIVPTPVDSEKFNPGVKPFQINTDKKFKFLFVGSVKERKGINILLEVFTELFSKNDDVCLVIKDDMIDYSEENQLIKNKIDELNKKAEIIYYSDDISEDELPSLYTACDCFVYPFKTEGYGIHVLEAMASQLPVIVTNGGGVIDFCNRSNSLLLKANWVDTNESKLETHELVDNIYCFEPDKENLKELLIFVLKDHKFAEDKARKARKYIKKYCLWETVSEKINSCLNQLKNQPIIRYNLKSIKKDLLSKGMDLFKQGNHKEAEKVFSILCRYDENNSDYFYNHALCHYYLNNYEEAINSFAESIELGMVTYNVCMMIANSLKKIGNHEDADMYYEKANELKGLV